MIQETDPNRAALHRLSAFAIRTQLILQACRCLVGAYQPRAPMGRARPDPTGQLKPGELRRALSLILIENGVDLKGAERAIGDQLDEIDLIQERRFPPERYQDALCKLLVTMSDSSGQDLLVETPLEGHFLHTVEAAISAQIQELSHLQREMEYMFSAPSGAVGVDLESEVQSVVDRFKDMQDGKNRSVNYIEPQFIVPIVMVPPDPFRRVVILLVENGVKYTRDMRNGQRPWVDIRIKTSDTKVEVEVDSWGCPVFEDEEEAVFERGVRGQAAKRLGIAGRGEGLAEARRLAESFGGSLRIWSQDHPKRDDWVPGQNIRTWAVLSVPRSGPDKASD
ncbi:ATP-binding protein [Caulobacter sp.]|uniref:sensor histidine kinase n=1 Tax=Caulobacter sp. TaxID=78 RepID=UPI001B026680|nr:ATP-binding protein [Caulobacter sp.]MBO9543877.1 ATP-binding protein [Caulobacter sp.]